LGGAALGCMSPKEADADGEGGGKSKSKKIEKDAKKVGHLLCKLERHPFKVVGIPAEDEFWSTLQAPLDTINELSDAMNDANESIIGLCEDEQFLAENVEKNVKQIVLFMKKELKKAGHEIRIEFHDHIITVTCEANPEGIVGKILLALIKLVEAIKTIVEKVPELLKQIVELCKEVHELPNKIQASALSAGLNPLQLGKAVKNTGLNVKYAAGAPKDIKEFIENVHSLAKTLKEVGEGEMPEEEKKDDEDKKEEKG